MLLAVVIFASTWSTGYGAASSVVVSATIPSATDLTNSCTQVPARELGIVQPGDKRATATAPGDVCRLQFQSSNDSAMLQLVQRDGAGTAMTAPDLTSRLSTGFSVLDAFAVEAYDTQLVYSVGIGGNFTRTTNGGTSWTRFSGQVGGELTRDVAVQPLAPDNWWVVGDNGMVARTTTGQAGAPAWSTTPGDNLRAKGWPASERVLSIEVVSGTLTWVGGTSGWVARTTDNGATAANWTVYQLPGAVSDTQARSIAVDPSNANKVVIADPWAGGKLWYTTTGGPNAAAWSFTAPSPSDYLQTVEASDSTHWYAGGYNGRLYTSTDGINWIYRDESLKEIGNVYSISSPTSAPNVALAVGDRGIVLRSSDSGATWTRQPTTTTIAYSSVAAPSATTAFAVGASETVVATTNSGTTWNVSSTYTGSFSIADIAAAPANGRLLIGVGGQGNIRRSTDGGTSWATVGVAVTPNALTSVSFGSDTVAWAAGERGTILRSSDGGASWATQASGTNERITSIRAVDERTVFAAGTEGVVLRSLDGGAMWSALVSGTTNSLQSIDANASGLVLAVGSKATVLRSTDNGLTFTKLVGLPSTGANLTGIVLGTGSTSYLTTTWSTVWRSTDQGATWIALGSHALTGAQVLGFDVMGTTIALAYANGLTAVSQDAGVSWAYPTSVTWVAPQAVTIVDPHRILTATSHSGYVALDPSATNVVADYGGANTWGNAAPTTNLFGVCVQAVGATTTVGTGFAVDADANCLVVDADPWRAVPTTITKLASTATPGAAGSADLVWGFRAAGSQPPGTYRAAVVFQLLAPNA